MGDLRVFETRKAGFFVSVDMGGAKVTDDNVVERSFFLRLSTSLPAQYR